jgi:hypothetical protein
MLTDKQIREHLLPDALEEERRNRKILKWSHRLLGGGFLWVVAYWTIVILVLNLVSREAARTIASQFLWISPGILAISFGFMGSVMYSKNTIMDLTEAEKKLL